VDVYWPGGEQSFPTASKASLAHDIVRVIAARFAAVRGTRTEPARLRLRDHSRN
jgi:hypothetical protein